MFIAPLAELFTTGRQLYFLRVMGLAVLVPDMAVDGHRLCDWFENRSSQNAAATKNSIVGEHGLQSADSRLL